MRDQLLAGAMILGLQALMVGAVWWVATRLFGKRKESGDGREGQERRS